MSGKQSVSIYFDAETLALLDEMADQEDRNRSNMMNVLIRRAAQERGVKSRPVPAPTTDGAELKAAS